MRAKELVLAWVDAFNRADTNALAAFYSPDAVNHQVAESPISGREAIRQMFASGFAAADMICIVENLFEDTAGAGWVRVERGVRPVGDMFLWLLGKRFGYGVESR